MPQTTEEKRKKDLAYYHANKKLKKTRPPGYEDARYCYYFLQDGECSLNNPVVRKRLARYVYLTIRFTHWIYKKNFIDAEDVFLEVQEEIKHIHPSQYGAKEGTDAITFLITKINTQIGREWWKYLKIMAPAYYDRLKEMQKTPSDAKRRYNKKYSKTFGKEQQQQLRDELAESYLCQQVQADFRNQTGMSYTFGEIRNQYPILIEEKRISIKNNRYIKSLRQSKQLIKTALNG